MDYAIIDSILAASVNIFAPHARTGQQIRSSNLGRYFPVHSDTMASDPNHRETDAYFLRFMAGELPDADAANVMMNPKVTDRTRDPL